MYTAQTDRVIISSYTVVSRITDDPTYRHKARLELYVQKMRISRSFGNAFVPTSFGWKLTLERNHFWFNHFGGLVLVLGSSGYFSRLF